MKGTSQTLLSLALILIPVGTVFTVVRGNAGEAAQATEEGHDHSAMAAADEQQPVVLTPDQANRIGVTLAPVELRRMTPTIETLGRVVYDERRLVTVSPKIDGWIEELFVDFTGAYVEAGQPLLSIYSPGLVSAQSELILALDLADAATDPVTAENARILVNSARRRLEYWDIPESEIARIVDSREVAKTVTLRAPSSGTIIVKNVFQGARITPGTAIYEIADLSRVWIETEVYEMDLALVAEGQMTHVTFESLPGEMFMGQVSFIYPTVSVAGRTGRIRIELPNPNGALRPGMYAKAQIMVPAAATSLIVPRSAVISTGTRSIVFVQAAGGALVPTEVTLGRKEGDDVEVLSGLEEGTVVVTSAAFLVDAESSLGALIAGMGNDTGQPDGMEGMAGMEGMGGPPAAPAAEDHSNHTPGGSGGDAVELDPGPREDEAVR